MTTREEILRAFVGERPCVICGQSASLAYSFTHGSFPPSLFKDGFILAQVLWEPMLITYCAICDECQKSRGYILPQTISYLLQNERKNDESKK